MSRSMSPAVLLVMVLVGGACGSGQTVSLTAPPTTIAVTEPGDAPTHQQATVAAEPTAVPGTRPDGDDLDELDRLLLGPADLPGSQIIGPMPFGDEPAWEIVDCDLMGEVFAAHEGTGRRIRATVGDAAVRQAAVELSDETAATAVLDAAEAVWDRCPQVTTDTGEVWWVEPIEMPDVDGWRTGGIAIGVSPSLTWTIGWYQQHNVVVIADLDAERPWDLRADLDRAIAAHLTGDVDPVEQLPALRPAATPTVAPLPVEPTATPMPPQAQAWRDHPAFAYLPDPAEFGDGWRLELDRVNEAAPSDPTEAIEGCEVDPPPTMAGLEVDYEPAEPASAPDGAPDSERFDSASGLVDVDVMVGIDDRDAAIATMVAFRDVAIECPGELQGLRSVGVTGEGTADERVAFELDDLELAGDDAPELARIVIARYDDVLLAVAWTAIGDTQADMAPSIDQLARLLDDWAARGG